MRPTYQPTDVQKLGALVKVGVSEKDLARLQAALPDAKITQTPPSDQDIAAWQKRSEQLKIPKR